MQVSNGDSFVVVVVAAATTLVSTRLADLDNHNFPDSLFWYLLLSLASSSSLLLLVGLLLSSWVWAIV